MARAFLCAQPLSPEYDVARFKGRSYLHSPPLQSTTLHAFNRRSYASCPLQSTAWHGLNGRVNALTLLVSSLPCSLP